MKVTGIQLKIDNADAMGGELYFEKTGGGMYVNLNGQLLFLDSIRVEAIRAFFCEGLQPMAPQTLKLLKQRQERERRYQLVVFDWQQPSEISRDIGIGQTALMIGMKSEFKIRHPDVSARLSTLIDGRVHLSPTPPFLWMIRLYENYRVIPKKRGHESWSKLGRQALLKRLETLE